MEQQTPTEIIAARIRALRQSRGMSAQALADRCAELGLPDLKRQAITNLENGRRAMVTVEELLVLALALEVAPVHLLLNPEDEQEPYQVAPGTMAPSGEVRAWVRGMAPLGGVNLRNFYGEVPRTEWGCLWVLTKPKADLPDETFREMRKWSRAAFAGYGHTGQAEAGES
ncbi:MAG: helix-turn-helix transcriptional regulator [Actinomadura sp.]